MISKADVSCLEIAAGIRSTVAFQVRNLSFDCRK